MTSRRRRAMASACGVALVLTGCGAAGQTPTGNGDPACRIAEDFPLGPIELIVPWSAGGGTDAVARLLGEQLSDAVGVRVNVVNRSGAGGVIGHHAIAEANPNGRVIGLITAEIAMMHWQGLTGLDHENLAAVSQVNADAAAVTVAADSDFESIDDLLQAIENDPGSFNASGTAQGGVGHVAMVGMVEAAGMSTDAVTWIPSDGAAPALQELVAGSLDFIVTSSAGEVSSMVDAGEVRTIAIMGDEPDANFPDVPLLVEETGIDFVSGTWRGIAAPADLDPEIVETLDCHISNIVATEEFEDFMATSGFSVVYRDAEEFDDFLASQDEHMGELMQAAGLAE